MALQLGVLRDALLQAGASKEQADAASEEVAGHENRLANLTTLVQMLIVVAVILLASQGAIWLQLNRLNSQVNQISLKIDHVGATHER